MKQLFKGQISCKAIFSKQARDSYYHGVLAATDVHNYRALEYCIFQVLPCWSWNVMYIYITSTLASIESFWHILCGTYSLKSHYCFFCGSFLLPLNVYQCRRSLFLCEYTVWIANSHFQPSRCRPTLAITKFDLSTKVTSWLIHVGYIHTFCLCA